MTNGVEPNLTWIANFIWNIADDVLRDIYVRGKYRDVILPMMVIRRLDAVLEPTKPTVLARKQQLENKVAHLDAALKNAAGEAFYNDSPFTLRDLKARAKQNQLKADFTAYLDGFSANVQEILDKFKFRNQLQTLIEADILANLIEKFLDSSVNLSPRPVLDAQGNVRLAGLDNHAMGTVFEELIRRFNEENNEEAGEHFTPRDVVALMADLIFLPIANQLDSGTYLVYDGACGTGGMLTVAEERLASLAAQHRKEVSIHLYGQEVQPETYAITKADLLIKGQGAEAEHMHYGSTLAADAFPGMEFDFMLSNPPYGKSWKGDLDRLGGKGDMSDPRFIFAYKGDPAFSLITRSSDGQLMFLVNKLSKMKRDAPLGSRIVEVHNGSSLFTGDAGQGESNIRRWIIENDWLEAIVALPLNMFYNTGIATYLWVLTNRKPAHRQGQVQLIDATSWFEPLRKNLGKKNCRLSDADSKRVVETFLAFADTEHAKIFPNAAFGYQKVTIERPLRLRVELDEPARVRLRRACENVNEAALADALDRAAPALGAGPHYDFNRFLADVRRTAVGIKLTGKRLKLLQDALAVHDSQAEPVLAEIFAPEKRRADPLYGMYAVTRDGKLRVVEYLPDPELRDTEQVPLLEPGGIEAFVQREVLPYAPDAWIDRESIKIGYEISFTRYFYKPQPLRTLDEIRAEIAGLEAETDGLLKQIIGASLE